MIQHIVSEVLFLMSLFVSYEATSLLGHAIFNQIDTAWFFAFKNNLFASSIIVYLCISLYNLVLRSNKKSNAICHDKRKQAREPLCVEITLTILGMPITIKANVIDKNLLGMHIVTEHSINDIIMPGHMLMIHHQEKCDQYKVQWKRNIKGQCHIGVCSV